MHGDGREARGPRQRAAAVRDVAAKIFHPREGPRVALLLLGGFHVPERPKGGAARFVRREAAARVLLLEQTQVRVDFSGELAFSSARADELTQPADEATH